MNEDALNSQFLTPARLMWVMDIGESTEAAWRAQKVISFFQQGRIVRYNPAAVCAFLQGNTVRARLRLPSTINHQPATNLDWARIERLISDQVEAHGLRRRLARIESGAAGMNQPPRMNADGRE